MLFRSALALMNETAFLEASRAMAIRLLRAGAMSDGDRLQLLFSLGLSRSATGSEQSLLLDSLKRYRSTYTHRPTDALRLLKIGDLPQSTIAPPAEQVAWMIVCSSVMNTDEFLTLH